MINMQHFSNPTQVVSIIYFPWDLQLKQYNCQQKTNIHRMWLTTTGADYFTDQKPFLLPNQQHQSTEG